MIDYYLKPKKELVDTARHRYTNIPFAECPKYGHLKINLLVLIPSKYKKFDDCHVFLVDFCHILSDYKEPFTVSVRPFLNGLLAQRFKIVVEKDSYITLINEKEGLRKILVPKE